MRALHFVTRWLREPFVHFLVAGLLFFALASWWSHEEGSSLDPRSAEGRLIEVKREALLDFVQARTKRGDAEGIARDFDALDARAQRDWIDRFVREEALVREAIALGLDRDDELIRRRLAQKMEFLTLGVFEEELRVDSGELEARYLEAAEDYRIPMRLSFTHVFVRVSDAEDPASDAEAQRRVANELRETLEAEGVGFEAARAYGDRFLYNRQYVDRTLDEVRGHFGDEMANALAVAPAGEGAWSGPYRSEHGWHLVLLTRRRESRLPSLASIEDVLREDIARQKRQRALEAGVGEIVSSYRVELGEGLAPGR